jgi:hypothetical protein
VVGEERFDLGGERRVAAARRGEKGAALPARRARERGVEDRPELLPAVGLHPRPSPPPAQARGATGAGKRKHRRPALFAA